MKNNSFNNLLNKNSWTMMFNYVYSELVSRYLSVIADKMREISRPRRDHPIIGTSADDAAFGTPV